MREKYQVTPRGAKVYIAKLDDAILDSSKGQKRRKFPSDDFPEIDIEFRGCVYVGVTRKTVYNRFRQHLNGGKKASWALHKFPSSRYYKECVDELTKEYGFTHLHKEIREKLESWVGYALYNAGYWVWGPHAHESYKKPEEDNPWGYDAFLGTGDFV
tara:strand:+ start:137 stop:607 length:471 start_codon:yes stop_codon:yes gene_type:complete